MAKPWKEGDPCKQCGTPVKLHKTYGPKDYYKECFICPEDNTVYFVKNDSKNKTDYRSDQKGLEAMLGGILYSQTMVTEVTEQIALLRRLADELEGKQVNRVIYIKDLRK